MEQLIPIIAIAGFFTTVIVLAYLYFNSRHKIRMALIEHGQDAGIFREERDASAALKYGMVAVGIGTGLLIGNMLARTGMEEEPAYFSMMLILGGTALILYYLAIRRKKGGKDEIV